MLKFLLAPTKEARAQECTQEMLMSAIDSKETHETCEAIKVAYGDEAKVALLKGKFPFLMPQVQRLAGEKKTKSGATANYVVAIDMDHLKVDPRAEYERIKQILEDYEDMGYVVLFAQISARNNGLHLMLAIPEGIEVDVEGRGTEDAICYYERMLGIQADHQCKNVNRGFYVTDRKHTLFVNEEILFGDVEMTRPKAIPEFLSEEGKSVESKEVATEAEEKVQQEYPTEYRDGITYAEIRDELLRLNPDLTLDENGRPMEGCRHSAEVYLAQQLKYITDGKVNWLKTIIPNYEEDERQWQEALESARKYPVQNQMSDRLRKAIENLTASKNASLSDSEENLPPERPENWPKMLKFCTDMVPDVCQDYIARAVFPLFASYLSGVQVWNPNNVLISMRFFSIVVAPSESGKGAIEQLQDVIMAEIREHDEEARKVLREYEEKERRTRNNKSDEKPEFPEGTYIQWLASDCTGPAFLKRRMWCEQAGDKPIYTYYSEIESMLGLEAKGRMDVTTIVRDAFDNRESGSERATSDGLTGMAKLAWNFNASTTPANYSFFKDWVGKGTAGRVDFVTIQPNPLKKFKYKRLTKEMKKKLSKDLRPYIENLKQAKGELECKEALEMAERMEAWTDERKELFNDLATKYMGNRARAIAFNMAMLLWIANGREWTKEIEDFAWWSLKYGLWVKNQLFYDQLQAQEKKARRINTHGMPGKKGILDMLGNDGFTDEEFLQAKRKINNWQGSLKDAQMALSVLKSRGNVIKSENGRWFKSDKYLREHGIA